MSNDGSATPEPGEQPSSTGRPAPETEGHQPPVTPPSDAWPTAPYGTRAAGDQPTAAYGTPHADQPTSPYGVPPVTGGGDGAAAGDAAPPTTPYGTPAAAASGEQTGRPAPGGYPAPGGAYAAPGYPQPGQPGQPQGGYPAYPGYPGQPGGNPPGGGGPYPYGGAPYGGSSAPTTDGVSIAALVTSLFGMNVVAVVLGVLGLRRTKKNGTQGRGLALAGLIIGAVELVALVVIGIAIAVAVVSHSTQMSSLRDDCESGVMQACDDLYYGSDVGSDDEEFGRTCGDRTDGYTSCAGIDAERFTYGDDEALDTLWDACGSGDGTACDELATTSSAGSEYEQFGLTCGGTTEAYGYCASGPAGADDSVDEGATGGSYGDDPAFDALWDACEAGSGTACDDLYMDSPAGSEYEDFGLTCGDRVDFAVSCATEIGD